MHGPWPPAPAEELRDPHREPPPLSRPRRVAPVPGIGRIRRVLISDGFPEPERTTAALPLLHALLVGARPTHRPRRPHRSRTDPVRPGKHGRRRRRRGARAVRREARTDGISSALLSRPAASARAGGRLPRSVRGRRSAPPATASAQPVLDEPSQQADDTVRARVQVGGHGAVGEHSGPGFQQPQTGFDSGEVGAPSRGRCGAVRARGPRRRRRSRPPSPSCPDRRHGSAHLAAVRRPWSPGQGCSAQRLAVDRPGGHRVLPRRRPAGRADGSRRRHRMRGLPDGVFP